MKHYIENIQRFCVRSRFRIVLLKDWCSNKNRTKHMSVLKQNSIFKGITKPIIFIFFYFLSILVMYPIYIYANRRAFREIFSNKHLSLSIEIQNIGDSNIPYQYVTLRCCNVVTRLQGGCSNVAAMWFLSGLSVIKRQLYQNCPPTLLQRCYNIVVTLRGHLTATTEQQGR